MRRDYNLHIIQKLKQNGSGIAKFKSAKFAKVKKRKEAPRPSQETPMPLWCGMGHWSAYNHDLQRYGPLPTVLVHRVSLPIRHQDRVLPRDKILSDLGLSHLHPNPADVSIHYVDRGIDEEDIDLRPVHGQFPLHRGDIPRLGLAGNLPEGGSDRHPQPR